jgi:hypothetical protein
MTKAEAEPLLLAEIRTRLREKGKQLERCSEREIIEELIKCDRELVLLGVFGMTETERDQ